TPSAKSSPTSASNLGTKQNVQTQVASPFGIAHQDAGDQKSGNDKENIDTDEPAPGPAKNVVEEHQDHRDHPKTLDVETLSGLG
ncbi:hypothetical protein, partial [Mycolicibacterium phlei]